MRIEDYDVDGICNTASDIVKTVSNKELDFSVESLQIAEECIQKLRTMNRKGLLNETACWNAAVCLGTYFGEVMLRDKLKAKGFSWQINESDLPVLMDSTRQNAVSPISKVDKKLSDIEFEIDQEGSLDSVYEVFLFLIERSP